MIVWADILRFTNEGNPAPSQRVEKTALEWRSVLTAEQYRITRLKGTEKRNIGTFCQVFEPGQYHCVCCDNPLFDSTEKFAGEGWPNFSQPIARNSIKYEMDHSLSRPRVEAMCNVCDAHLGHVFRFGPKPSRLRYCINSESIKLNNNHD